MVVITEPKLFIEKLWDQVVIAKGTPCRLMKYVLRTEYDGTVLLHNVVTGQLVALDQSEKEYIDALPLPYNSLMEPLVRSHFIVPVDYDEHRKVSKIRVVLRKFDDVQKSKHIIHYTILPTTACNARCYYCFEQGVEAVSMTRETADELIEFIKAHCGDKKTVRLSWFGGEPTIAAERIDQICEGLRKAGIIFKSDMTTNGYLFDERLVERAVQLWQLNSVSISMDGTEKNYNKIKAFINTAENPYKRVLHNVKLLLNSGVHVNVRMNFDLRNYLDFKDLVNTLKEEFPNSSLLKVHVHPIIGSFKDQDGIIAHGSEEWFREKIVELNDIAREAGFFDWNWELPSLSFKVCQAADDESVTITANGDFVRCPEQFDKNQITGNLKEGITDFDLVQSWKNIIDYRRCIECVFYPDCIKIKNCSSGDSCSYYLERLNLYCSAMKRKFVSV